VTQAFETVTNALQVADSWRSELPLGKCTFARKNFEGRKGMIDVIKSGTRRRGPTWFGPGAMGHLDEQDGESLYYKAHGIDPDDPDIQRSWIETLKRSERIKYYESYLADANNSDPDERSDTEIYLSYLKERAKQHGRSCAW